MPSSRYGGGAGTAFNAAPAATAASTPAVLGGGTVGNISMWTGTSPSGNSILGDTIITQLNGNIGIGLATPVSKLSVKGMIETTLGGYKFPDGTVQTTAAVSGLQSVIHDSTLAGEGTAGSPLGLAVPLSLVGSLPCCDSLLEVRNTGIGGSAVRAAGGGGTSSGFGGTAMLAIGGGSGGTGGTGLHVLGGGTVEGTGGIGVSAFGGGAIRGVGGVGIQAVGGFTHRDNTNGGVGLKAFGGGTDSGIGGAGVQATGGNFNGRGVIATGGIGPAGYGVEAIGGASEGAGHVAGAGIKAMGGASSGSNSASGTGIFAMAGEATNGATRGRAGIFEGDVSVSEHLTVGGDLDVTGTKNFKIDHPLDPENKYLLHASIESSEVLNIYSGNVVTGANGQAVVTLPEWFEALNRDLRYQLTVIGTFAQAIVSDEVRNNRFTIKTTAPNVKVSWQVTGVRSDEVMRKRPFKAEENKH